MSDVTEDDDKAFVVYVPPNNGDTTFESCLRLGAGPTSSTADEEKTYRDVVSSANLLSNLSSSTYPTNPGIALLTPGTINLVAAGGVNTTCGSYSSSTIGPSYTVTQEPGHIISASYTDKGAFGWWSTSNYTQASTVSVNTNLLQASIGLGMMYGVSGPLTCSNNWGFMWNSTVGYAVTSTVARVVAIGTRTVVANAWNGSNNEYYTADQASSTAATFKWQVPVPSLYASFDAMQKLYCALVDAAAIVTTGIATVYAAEGLIQAGRQPGDVRVWLQAAEPVALTCTVLDGLLCAAGLVLGILVDNQADAEFLNLGSTSFVIGPGSFELTTKTVVKGSPRSAPALILDRGNQEITLSLGDDKKGPMLRFNGKPALVTLGTTGKGVINMTDDSLLLQFGSAVSLKLDAKGVHLNAGGHSVDVTSSEVSITGQQITIEGAMTKINSLETDLKAAQEGLAAAKQAAATASTTATDALKVATAANVEAGAAKRAVDKLTAGKQ